MCSINSSLNKFRGSLVGALLGDCLGAPFEGRYWGHGMIVEDSVIKDEISPEKLEKKKKGFIMVYTGNLSQTKYMPNPNVWHTPILGATNFFSNILGGTNKIFGERVGGMNFVPQICRGTNFFYQNFKNPHSLHVPWKYNVHFNF